MVGLRSCGIIFVDFSHVLLVLHANVSLYWDSHQSFTRLQIEAGICAVATVDVVTIDKSIGMIF